MLVFLVRYGLLVYFAATFAVVFVWRSYVVYRTTGQNPVVLPTSDDAYGYVGRALKVALAACMAAAGIVAVLGHASPLGRLVLFEQQLVFALGWTCLVLSLAWIAVAQAQMGKSWRIGIDSGKQTPLVDTGLFSVSRNPIFLGMRVQLLGVFLVLPTAVTLAILVAGEMLMQVQVRLEELHLAALHGDGYKAYTTRVRRWL